MKSIDTTIKPVYCKSCFKEIHLSPVRELIERKPLLCNDCISQLKIKMVVRKIEGIKILFLSEYSGLMKTWLMNFKEYGDIELAPCFLNLFDPILRVKFLGFQFVPLPSKEERIQARGFSHLEEILKASHFSFSSVLRQSSTIEQKNRNGPERFHTKGIYLTPEAKNLTQKKVVLFDDVMTTGATFRQSLEQIKKIKPREIEGLILMDNDTLENLKIY